MLYRCNFEALQFRRCHKTLRAARGILEKRLQGQLVRGTLVASALARIQEQLPLGPPSGDPPGDWCRHNPLMLREREMSVEERICNLALRQATNAGATSPVTRESRDADLSCPVVTLPGVSAESRSGVASVGDENTGCLVHCDDTRALQDQMSVDVDVGTSLLRVPNLPHNDPEAAQGIGARRLDMQPALR